MMCALAIFLGIIIGGFVVCLYGAIRNSGGISLEEDYGDHNDIYFADEGATAACLRRDDVGGKWQAVRQ